MNSTTRPPRRIALPRSYDGVRFVLYCVLALFSFILLWITVGRVAYTEHLSHGDPLDEGIDFYDPVVVELMATSILLIGVSAYFAFTIHRRLEMRYISRIWFEVAVLSVLWLLLIVGAGIATSIWPNLNFCVSFNACRVLQAMLAFAWLSWIVLTALIIISLVYAFRFRGWDHHMHSWDSSYKTDPVMQTV